MQHSYYRWNADKCLLESVETIEGLRERTLPYDGAMVHVHCLTIQNGCCETILITTVFGLNITIYASGIMKIDLFSTYRKKVIYTLW